MNLFLILAVAGAIPADVTVIGNAEFRLVVTRAFRKCGYMAVHAKSGMSAITDNRFDVRSSQYRCAAKWLDRHYPKVAITPLVVPVVNY